MEAINLGYSTKNIPIPSKNQYLQSLIQKTETFIKNIRWRAYFFLHPGDKPKLKENYGFKSTKTPPVVQELSKFEESLSKMIQDIQFRNVNDNFQKQLKKDLKQFKKSEHMIIPADKTTNFYKVQPNEYEKLLRDSITKDYKKSPADLEKNIHAETKEIATNLEIEDRVYTTGKNEAFLTLKDHKPNFRNRPTCRLINPCKPEIGKVSKKMLEQINTTIKNKSKLNQWKNTNEVITWFEKIEKKDSNTFIIFDICEFYPSITNKLLGKALDFAAQYVEIEDDITNTIMHTKKSLLYSKGQPWCKNKSGEFDVTMGSYDGAETCELIGLYILAQLKPLNVNVGLYRDDGLAVCNKPPREVENIKKEICKIFEENDLKITIQANLKVTDFLDITLNLNKHQYKPYMKPNNRPLYVNKKSNHPPAIIKNIPEGINKRLSR